MIMRIIAEYATSWREIFFEWLVYAPEGRRTVDIRIRDGGGADLTVALKISIVYPPHANRVRPERIVSRAPMSIYSPVARWVYGTFHVIWEAIASRSLANYYMLRASGWTLVVGIENDIMAAALADWYTRHPNIVAA
jgi:hypothetical protein